MGPSVLRLDWQVGCWLGWLADVVELELELELALLDFMLARAWILELNAVHSGGSSTENLHNYHISFVW